MASEREPSSSNICLRADFHKFLKRCIRNQIPRRMLFMQFLGLDLYIKYPRLWFLTLDWQLPMHCQINGSFASGNHLSGGSEVQAPCPQICSGAVSCYMRIFLIHCQYQQNLLRWCCSMVEEENILSAKMLFAIHTRKGASGWCTRDRAFSAVAPLLQNSFPHLSRF